MGVSRSAGRVARSRIVSALAARRWACARLIGSAVVIAVGLGESRTTFVSGTKGRAFRGATLIRRCRTLVTDGRSASPRSPIGAALYRWRSAPEPTGVRGSRRLAFGPEAPGSIPRRRRSGSHQPPDLWVDVATSTRPVHSPLFVMSAEYGQVASEASSARRDRPDRHPAARPARGIRRHRSVDGRPAARRPPRSAWARITTSTRSSPGTDRTRPGTAQANPSPNGVAKPGGQGHRRAIDRAIASGPGPGHQERRTCRRIGRWRAGYAADGRAVRGRLDGSSRLRRRSGRDRCSRGRRRRRRRGRVGWARRGRGVRRRRRRRHGWEGRQRREGRERRQRRERRRRRDGRRRWRRCRGEGRLRRRQQRELDDHGQPGGIVERVAAVL